VAAEPARMPAAGRETPLAGDAVAALDDNGAAGAGQFRAPGENAVDVAEYLTGALRRQIRRDQPHRLGTLFVAC